MSYKRRTIEKWKHDGLVVMFVFFLLSLVPVGLTRIYSQAHPPSEFIDPRSTAHFVTVIKTVPGENIDGWVDKYTKQYFDGWKVSEVKMIMHCLLHRESGHGASNSCGDGGLACGPLQFHYLTWTRMRGQMLKAGLIDEIGSRLNAEQAVHTTIWAIANGHAKEWGPIFRDSKGSDYASCQTPSWY